MRLPLGQEWHLRLLGLLLTAGVVVGGGTALVAEHRAHVRADLAVSALTDTIAQAKGVAQTLASLYARAEAERQRAADGVTVARTIYKTIRDTIVLRPVTAHDTASTLALLPAFAAACDSVVSAAQALAATSEAAHQRAVEALGAKDTVIATEDRLVAALHAQLEQERRGPRFRSAGEVGYDPIVGQPVVAASVGMRVVGEWSVVARAEQVLASNERARIAVAVSHPLF